MLRLLTWCLCVFLLVAAVREWEAEPGEDVAPLPLPVDCHPGLEEKLPQAETPRPAQQEEPLALPDPPTAEQVAALEPDLRVAQAAAVKTVLLSQMLRLVREEHRLTPANLSESADAAQVAGAPLFWQQAMRVLASGSLSLRERRDLEKKLQEFYTLYGVDALAVRLFVETSDLTADEMVELLPRLPMEHLFNLPPQQPAAPRDLAVQAAVLKEVFSALQTRFESVHDKASADAAADALIPFLSRFDSTQQLRLSGPMEQVEAFSAYRDFFPQASKAIHEQRLRLHNAAYFSSPSLRAINYLLQ